MNKASYVLFLIIVVSVACKKPYNPPVITSAPGYLVVEGTIISGTDSTIIKLSSTVSLSKGVSTNTISHATLTVESDATASFPLTETKPGYYTSAGLNLDNTRKYRLRIKTPDNQQYLSDFEAVSVTPPIDSIGFTVSNNGANIYANTHDPNNNTHYYRWDYAETWQFHAEYFAQFMTDGTKIVIRPADQQIYFCFAGDVSSTILLGSSAKLTQDVIYQSPITFLPSTSEKVEVKYSILLRQYALTNDAFKFWTNLKKNTEQLGSIFDAEPSEINGNIHNINNPKIPVLGYISASTVQTKRIFIDNTQLPPTWRTTYPYSCELDSFYFKHPIDTINQVAEFLVPLGSGSLPISAFPAAPPPIKGYLGASAGCADCTLRGTKQTPVFWQ